MAAFKLNPLCALDAELARVLLEQLEGAVAAASDKQESKKDRIHRARTRCKKARAVLKLVRSENQAWYRRENRSLSVAARRLSALRDADVALDSFSALRLHAENRLAPAQFIHVVYALKVRRRAAAYSSNEVERALDKFQQELRKIKKRIEERHIKADFETVSEDFRRTYQRARSALSKVEVKPRAEVFHGWRKASKAFLYQCRLLRLAWPSAMKELVKELDGLAGLLGQEHDLSVLRRKLRRFHRKGELAVNEDAFVATLKLVESRRQELRRETVRIGQRLFAEKPRGLARRLSRWWQLAGQDAPASASDSVAA